jgi:hypothetical protein
MVITVIVAIILIIAGYLFFRNRQRKGVRDVISLPVLQTFWRSSMETTQAPQATDIEKATSTQQSDRRPSETNKTSFEVDEKERPITPSYELSSYLERDSTYIQPNPHDSTTATIRIQLAPEDFPKLHAAKRRLSGHNPSPPEEQEFTNTSNGRGSIFNSWSLSLLKPLKFDMMGKKDDGKF